MHVVIGASVQGRWGHASRGATGPHLGHTGDEYNTGGALCGDATQIIAPGMSLFEPKHERGKSDQGALSAAPGEPEPGMSRGPLEYLLACCAHIDTDACLATDGIAL